MSAAVPPVWSTWHPLGHLPKFLDDPVELFTEAHRLHGPVASMRLATNTVLTINDPGAARALLLEHQRNFVKRTPGYTVLRRLLGDGLVTAMGDDWKRKRRIANPAFHRRCLAGFVDTMNASTEDWLARIDAELPEGPIDLHPEMVKLTLTIAGITLFHVDLTEDSDEVSQAVRTALDAFNSLVASSLPLLAWLPTPTNRRMNEAVARLDKVVQGIIEGRRRTPSEHTDLLAMLMGLEDTETGSRLNDKELRDEVVTTLLAGHETTANGLAWALWLLAGHPEVADAVAAEVRAQVAAHEADKTSLQARLAAERRRQRAKALKRKQARSARKRGTVAPVQDEAEAKDAETKAVMEWVYAEHSTAMEGLKARMEAEKAEQRARLQARLEARAKERCAQSSSA